MIRKMDVVFASVLGTLTAVTGCSKTPTVNFNKEVDPLLRKYCAECHLTQGKGTLESGFQVDSYDTIMKGTKYGPVIVPGDSTSSTLYRLVAGKVHKSIQMPHGKEKLSPEEITLIQNWIDQGAKNN